MSHLRDVRRIAAARTIGERHPWSALYGARVLGLAVAIGAAVFVVLGLRWVWHHAHLWLTARSPAVPVSHTVSAGPVSWVPWWGWVALVLALVLLVRLAPRIVYRLRWGFWPV